MSGSHDGTITLALLAWIESIYPGERVNFGGLELDHDNISVLIGVGDPYVKRYKSGGGIAALNYQVMYRTYKTDTAGQMEALQLLGDTVDRIQSREFPPDVPSVTWVDTSIDLPPHLYYPDENYVDFQMTGTIRYLTKG